MHTSSEVSEADVKMPTKRSKQEAVMDLTPENPVRRSSRQTLVAKRLEYSPKEEKPVETPRKKMRLELHSETTQKHIKSEEQTNEGLSAYELERLENIKKNQEFLSSLNIYKVSEELKQSVRRKPTNKGLKRSPTVTREVLPPRRSNRLQNIEAAQLELPKVICDPVDMPPPKKSGPLPMHPINMSEIELPEQLLKIWTESSAKEKLKQMELKQYRSTLSKMKITKDNVAKVVKKRIFSAAFHPSSSNILMAAGDYSGQVGLWSLSSTWGDDGVLLFEPHSRPVTCMAFSSANPTYFLSTSYDGSMRRMDVEKAMFDDVYDVDDGLKTFDFLSHDCMSVVVGTWFGDIAFVDRRTPGNTHESLHRLDTKTVRCVSVHPLQKQYFAVAESQFVNIYDSRFMKKSKSTPVCQLMGHSKSITSAYFSPNSGNRILTSCMDNYIRIYDTSATSKAPLLKTIRHDMQTGRWLSKLSAVWDPKQEDCFAVGYLSRPRCVQVYHESGQLLHTFSDEENLCTVQSVVAFHPTRSVLMGGNSSGRLHVFAGHTESL
ncbi:WD repeat-containing protein 76 [Periophthalmus magnuspinnatus]|uniref:WD repeat-containing protein 76 n=1 Tax=Periophthalmus magnuspinnatus TaxID=409849 RepID=UPI002436B656|nr:WD repeat-containing protein 76 [Periophthalmus magnuspinnatus]